MRQFRNILKKASQILFTYGQSIGLYILPRHYYVPLASWSDLKKTKKDWNRPIDLSAISINLEKEKTILQSWMERKTRAEVVGNPFYKEAIEQRAGPGYGYIEAQVLHGFMRALAPPRIIEIGSGVSTSCMLAARELNRTEGKTFSEIICVEPYPSALMRNQPVSLIEKPVEKVDLEIFDILESGDFLFIDSSHAVKPCGDTSRIYLEILPRLKPGVHVHIHDIYLPYAFQRNLTGYSQWMETALLVALLSHSPRYEVSLSLSHLHHLAPEAIKAVLDEYDPQPNEGGLRGGKRTDQQQHFPSSTYLMVK